MRTAQKDIALGLINETLYRRQPWYPAGTIVKEGFELRTATTKLGKAIVTLDYAKNTITVNRKRQRLPKAIATDLFSIVRLKIAKNIQKYAPSNSTR
jgi:hypothetical protein